MTSATLFREGLDLDELLAELDAEHDGRVRVVDVEYGRDGGVMGFFARRTVGVHYVLTSSSDADDPAYSSDSVDSVDSAVMGPLEAMLRAAESAELASQAVLSGRAPEAAPGDNVEFARMLLDIAAQKAAERQAQADPEPTVFAPTTFRPAPSPVPLLPRVVPPSPSGRAVADHSDEQRPLDEDKAVLDLAATRAELLARARTRPVGAHRADPVDSPAAGAPTVATPTPVAPPVPMAARPAPVRAARPIAPPVAEPVAPPVAEPIATPVAEPIATPVAEPIATPVAEPIATPVAEPAVAHAPAPVRTPLTLRRQLSEIGVPLAWIDDDNGSAYEVIEQLVRRVPAAGRLDLGPGQLLVVAGPAAQAQAEAVRLCGQLRLDPAAIRTAGCGPDPIRHRRQAASLELDVRGRRGEPCVVVVATDSSGDTGGLADLAWAADIVATLEPDQLYLVVDATCRVADVRRTVATLGRVTALAVVAAARSASPASLWELGIAVASLDGATATRGRWAALLIDRLTDLDGD